MFISSLYVEYSLVPSFHAIGPPHPWISHHETDNRIDEYVPRSAEIHGWGDFMGRVQQIRPALRPESFFPPFTFTSQLLVHTYVIARNNFLFNKDAFRNTAVLDFNWLILTEPQTRFQDLPTSATHDFPTPISRIEIELLLGMPSGMASLPLYLLRRQTSNGSRQRFGDRGWARARLKVDALLILGTRFRI